MRIALKTKKHACCVQLIPATSGISDPGKRALLIHQYIII